MLCPTSPPCLQLMVSRIGAEAFPACLPSEVLTYTQKHHALQQVPAGLQSHLGVSALSWGFGFFSFGWFFGGLFWQFGGFFCCWLVWGFGLGVGFFGRIFFCLLGRGGCCLFVLPQNKMFKLLQINTELQHSYLRCPQEFLAFKHLSWRWINGIPSI